MPVNALHEKHTYTYLRKSMYEASSGYACVCTKGAANRAQKATELRNSGSRPNDNCFLALAAKQTHMHVNVYAHVYLY